MLVHASSNSGCTYQEYLEQEKKVRLITIIMRIFRMVRLLYIILNYSQGILTKDTEEEKIMKEKPEAVR
jgi:hypothetical protein